MSSVDVYISKLFEEIYIAFKFYSNFMCMLVSEYEHPMSANSKLYSILCWCWSIQKGKRWGGCTINHIWVSHQSLTHYLYNGIHLSVPFRLDIMVFEKQKMNTCACHNQLWNYDLSGIFLFKPLINSKGKWHGKHENSHNLKAAAIIK